MAQRLFHHQKDGAAGFGEHHPVGMQPGGREGGGEQVGVGDRPKHGAALLGQQASEQQGGGGGMLGIRAGAGYLVQRALQQATAGQVRINGRNAEAQHAGLAVDGMPFQPRNARAKSVQPGWIGSGRVGPGRVDPGRIDPGRVDPGRFGPGRFGRVLHDLSERTYTERQRLGKPIPFYQRYIGSKASLTQRDGLFSSEPGCDSGRSAVRCFGLFRIVVRCGPRC